MDGPGVLPDSLRELVAWLVVIPVVVALIAGIGMLGYVKTNPGAPYQLEAAYDATLRGGLFSVVGGQNRSVNELRLPVEDAEYLNRAYRDLNQIEGDRVGEQAYCISLVDGRMNVQQAGTLEAREGRVTYTTANCHIDVFGVARPVSGTLHFHPPGSDPVLSGPETAKYPDQNDKASFLSSDYELSCVQAGLVTTTPGERTAALQCFRKPPSGEIDADFPTVPVVITG